MVQTEQPTKTTSAVKTIGIDAIFAFKFLKSLFGGRDTILSAACRDSAFAMKVPLLGSGQQTGPAKKPSPSLDG
jgi:hypothetical protein